MTKKEKLIKYYGDALKDNKDSSLLIQHSYKNEYLDMVYDVEFLCDMEQLELFIDFYKLNDDLIGQNYMGNEVKLLTILLIDKTIRLSFE